MSFFDNLRDRLRYYKNMARFRNLNTQEVFTLIYKENYWGGENGEFNSGPGTTNPNVHQYINVLTDFLRQNKVQSLLDIGCGDFRVMREVVNQVSIDYTGGDVVQELVDHHNQHYANDHTRFRHLNAITDTLPPAEAVSIRQVLQHLTNEQVLTILKKLKPYRYVIITEHVTVGEKAIPNLDKQQGPNVRLYKNSGLYIEQPPFNLEVSRVLLEYREDMDVFGTMIPAVIRTSLIENK
ncbi:class I SAM-dependent methyltransferase [Tellurirhabdus bombi]|uniref:class I SAM-dependent methyltransferase n=1 Tax=Tellurirhabdus bombi TaxID=2907205 RepID=UPI001F26EE3F|nr:class I SAM-dependent methyltransferase [Tellurirhabdus bombi]